MTLYVPSHFRVGDEARLFEFIERYAFGTLVSTGPAGLHVSHIPFVPERGADGAVRLLGHVARANPHWQALAGAAQTLAIFHGPHAYVSPTWYQQHPSVPTWNYAVVHAHGKARLHDEFELRDLVGRLAAIYEEGRPKPWRIADQPPEYVSKMVSAIVGFTLEVEKLEGKFKLSQNRPVEAPRVIAALEAAGEPELASLMRENPPAKG
jgi:transcriptional regulator